MRTHGIALLLAGLSAFTTANIRAQGNDLVYRTIDAATLGAAADHIHSWAELSPDERTIAISATGTHPLLLLDATDLRIQRTIDVSDWKAGSRASFSTKGGLLLLEEIEYLGHSSDKPHPHRFAVVDLTSGALVVKDQRAYAASLSPDERSLYSLNDDGVSVTDIATGQVTKVAGLSRGGNAMAVSPDGTRIAVAHQPTEADLANVPSVRNDKKVIKAALKAGQVVLLYDMATGQRAATVTELFDKVFRVEYSPGGKELWVHAKPGSHKSANPDRTLSYVDVADPNTGVMGRASFPSHALYEPTFCANASNSLFALGSQKGWHLEVHVYDRKRSSMLGRFVIEERLFEDVEAKGEKWSDARTSFVLLPDGKRLLMTFGGQLIEWTHTP